MRKSIVVIMLIMSSCYAMAQATTDLGVQVAAATYWGDIQNVNYSKSITPVVGILGRYNFNRRLAIRGQLFTGNLKPKETSITRISGNRVAPVILIRSLVWRIRIKDDLIMVIVSTVLFKVWKHCLNLISATINWDARKKIIGHLLFL